MTYLKEYAVVAKNSKGQQLKIAVKALRDIALIEESWQTHNPEQVARALDNAVGRAQGAILAMGVKHNDPLLNN